MASSGGSGEAREPPDAARAKSDRRADALRANLKRRKAQTRARDEARPEAGPSDAAGRDGYER